MLSMAAPVVRLGVPTGGYIRFSDIYYRHPADSFLQTTDLRAIQLIENIKFNFYIIPIGSYVLIFLKNIFIIIKNDNAKSARCSPIPTVIGVIWWYATILLRLRGWDVD